MPKWLLYLIVELKIDATVQKNLARRFNVDGFPTLLLMENARTVFFGYD